MTEHRKFHYALVEFRQNPARPEEGRLDLGVLLEFTTAKHWVVALVARATFAAERLDELDPLSRELLEQAPTILERELRKYLDQAVKPGDVLRLMSEHNPWSVYIAPPGLIEVPNEQAHKRDTTEELAERYALCAYRTAWEVPKQAAARRSARGKATRALQLDHPTPKPPPITPVWMIPPKVVAQTPL